MTQEAAEKGQAKGEPAVDSGAESAEGASEQSEAARADLESDSELPDETESLGETVASDDVGADLAEVLARLARAEEESINAKDQLLRAQAELQNLRRRSEQDIERAHKFGLERFSGELLLVMDNLERAAAAAAEHEDEVVRAIHEGVNLTLKSFVDCFAKFDIAAVDPEGEPFDPALHQAVSMRENGEVEPNTVVEVLQKGYTLHGRVLRPAMVVVSTEPS